VGGAVLGAAFVTALPLVFQRYADAVPFVTGAGGSGLAAGEAARYLYGLAIVLVVLFAPDGLVGIGRRLRRRRAAPGTAPPDPARGEPGPPPSTSPSDRPAEGTRT
jgi:branched-chain amino acid transport system permease protein